MSNRNPKGKSLTPRQEKALELGEAARMKARIIELGVAVFLNEEDYRTGTVAASVMLLEAVRLREEAAAMFRQANVDTRARPNR